MMAVLGIISCEILEIEFAKLLSDDKDVRRINVIQDSHSKRLINLLGQQHNLYCIPHPHAFHPEPGESLELLIQVLALGLHRNRRVLGQALIKTAQALRPYIDALLLGYGQCGGAIGNAHNLLDLDIPIFQPMDGNKPVDDCVALCLGGRQTYYSEQRKIAGTYFLTPGWGKHWHRMLDPHNEELSQVGLKRALRDYERALMVHSPAQAEEELLRDSKEFSHLTGLRLESKRGTMAGLISAWEYAKSSLQKHSAGNLQ
jgi:hypothetical protein